MLDVADTAALLARPLADNRSSSLVDEQNIGRGSVLELEYDHDGGNSRNLSLIDCMNAQTSVSVPDDVIAPLPPSDLPHTDVNKPLKQRHSAEITSPVSYKSYSGSRHTATTCSLEASPPLSPRVQCARSSTQQRQKNPRAVPHRTFQRQVSVTSEDEESRNRNRRWYRRASPADRQQKRTAALDDGDNDGDQSAIWHHVFMEVASKHVKNADRPETCYNNCFDDVDDDYCDGDYSKDRMELKLLKPAPAVSDKRAQPGCAAVIPNSATSNSVVMETASIGGGRMTTRTRLHKYQQQFSFCAGDRRLSVSATNCIKKPLHFNMDTNRCRKMFTN
jgi:hypothetical protein